MLRTGVFTPLELLRMRCVDAPRTIFHNRKIGALEAGYEASFLALSANPLEQPTAIGRIEHRVKQGIELGDL